MVFDGRRRICAGIEEHANHVAGGLNRAGIREGHHVALICRRRPEFVTSCFGILKLDAVAVRC